MSVSSAPPVILTIAGSDSSAGAGLQADLKAITAHGGYGVCAVTAIVSEVPGNVRRVDIVDPAMLADQLEILGAHYPLAAVKTGMLANRDLADICADFLESRACSGTAVIVDPVMVATSGDRLLDEAAIDVYRQRILPRASLATPNLGEAAVLLGRELTTAEEMSQAASDFVETYQCPVFLKGGHLHKESTARDVFCDGSVTETLSVPRVDAIDTHGTGCTLSAAIAACVGRGENLLQACSTAKAYITAAIGSAYHWPKPANIHALNHQPAGLPSR